MQREIKFRAWDTFRKKMSYEPVISDGTDGGETSYVSMNLAIDCFDGVLMQYTGLKDKNGKEIYEGDIVQRGVILFDRGKFQGYYYESNGGIAENWEDDLYQERDIEVLGNVYENPELMREGV
jgi:uncharacterized phage protein (TIGR01671 family)